MKKIFKKSILVAFALIISLAGMSYAEYDDSDYRVVRIAGRDRYDTAIKVDKDCSQKMRSNVAVISNGEQFKKSLYASYLASSIDAHFYPTVKGYISKAILNEILSNNVKKVYIVGDYNDLSKSIDNTLLSKNINVKRFTENRDLDGAINLEIYSLIGKNFYGDVVMDIVINDDKYPDLIASLPFASRLSRKGLHLYDYKQLVYGEDNRLEDAHFIIGGFNSVPRTVRTFSGDCELGLNYRTNEEGDIIWKYSGRLAGEDRYETAIEIARANYPIFEQGIDTVVIVDGDGYADALSSSKEAMLHSGVILLTESNKLNEKTKKFIKDNNIKNIIIVGGERSISKDVEEELKSL